MSKQASSTGGSDDAEALASLRKSRRELVRVWLRETVISIGGGTSAVAAKADVSQRRLAQCLSAQRPEVPTAPELEGVARAAGQSVPAHVLEAALAITNPTASRARVVRDDGPFPEKPDLKSALDIKQWLRAVRDISGVSLPALASTTGISPRRIQRWENPGKKELPSLADLRLIAAACQRPVPAVDWRLELPASRASLDRRQLPVLAAKSLAEEILEVGRTLSKAALGDEHIERNAAFLRDWFASELSPVDALNELALRFELSEDEAEDLLRTMLAAPRELEGKTAQFALLMLACARLADAPAAEANKRLRPRLGPDLSLRAAQRYGSAVLGRDLPLAWYRTVTSQLRVAYSAHPEWAALALQAARTAAAPGGAAEALDLWMAVQNQSGTLIEFGSFVRVLSGVEDLAWLDAEGGWFAFVSVPGNVCLQRAEQIIATAGQAVSRESILTGVLRPWVAASPPGTLAMPWPVAVFNTLLDLAPRLQRVDADRFTLADGVQAAPCSAVEAQLLSLLDGFEGIAPAQALREAAEVRGLAMEQINEVLQGSPLLEAKPDGELVAVRGRAVSAEALIRARAIPRIAPLPRARVDAEGAVSWDAIAPASALPTGDLRVPAHVFRHIPPGTYDVEGGRQVRVIRGRRPRLEKAGVALNALGVAAGDALHITLWPDTRRVRFERSAR